MGASCQAARPATTGLPWPLGFEKVELEAQSFCQSASQGSKGLRRARGAPMRAPQGSKGTVGLRNGPPEGQSVSVGP
eukprot:3980770-Pyramimonas_sp.AAC.1